MQEPMPGSFLDIENCAAMVRLSRFCPIGEIGQGWQSPHGRWSVPSVFCRRFAAFWALDAGQLPDQ